MTNFLQVAHCQLLLITSHDIKQRKEARSYDFMGALIPFMRVPPL